MLAKECDRCKKFYKYYEDDQKCNAISVGRISDAGHIGSHTYYDLCPDCMKEVKQWFNRGSDESTV